jgi:class 3 adenylate cyclase
MQDASQAQPTPDRERFRALTERWKQHSKRGVSIALKIGAMVTSVFLLSAIATSVAVAWLNQNARISETRFRARSTAYDLSQLYLNAAKAHGSITLAGVRLVLDNWFLDDSATQDLAWAYILDTEQKVVAGYVRANLIDGLNDSSSDEEIRKIFLGGTLKHDDFLSVQSELTKGEQRLGRISIGYSLAHIRRDFREQLWIAVFVGFLAAFLLALLMSIFLRGLVLTPLRQLAFAMEDVRRGRFDSRAPVVRQDEIGALTETFNYMMHGLEEREQLEDAFQRYASRQLLEKIMSSGHQLLLSGETRRVTVLFSDIRGFTSMSERLLPEQVVGGLNEYFTEMVEVVFRHDGFINKFLGDAMMAVWGAPFEHDQPELRAVRAGVEMLEALRQLNIRRAERGESQLEIGIGINTGFAVAGNIGHVERMEYTVIGDAVNIAQRIEGQTKKLGHPLLVAEETFAVVADIVVAEELPTLMVKGKEMPLKLFGVSALKTSSPPLPQAAFVDVEVVTTAVTVVQPASTSPIRSAVDSSTSSANEQSDADAEIGSEFQSTLETVQDVSADIDVTTMLLSPLPLSEPKPDDPDVK